MEGEKKGNKEIKMRNWINEIINREQRSTKEGWKKGGVDERHLQM